MTDDKFEFELPVSKQKVTMRRSTLMDEFVNDEEFLGSGGGESEEKPKAALQPWALIGRVITQLGTKKGPLKGEELLGLPSQDGAYLMRCWTRLNLLTPKLRREIDSFFEVPATESSPS